MGSAILSYIPCRVEHLFWIVVIATMLAPVLVWLYDFLTEPPDDPRRR